MHGPINVKQYVIFLYLFVSSTKEFIQKISRLDIISLLQNTLLCEICTFVWM